MMVSLMRLFSRCSLLLETHVNALGTKKAHSELLAGEKLMSRVRDLIDTTDGLMDGCSRTYMAHAPRHASGVVGCSRPPRMQPCVSDARHRIGTWSWRSGRSTARSRSS